MAATMLSFYEVLGIPASASVNDIKSAYRRLARECHPDAVSFEHKENSANEFMKIHTAYSTLSDPDKRAIYDRSLFVNRRRPFGYAAVSASPDFGFSQYSCRSWETDQCW